MCEIKLIAFDLDGTLLDSQRGLSERNAAALQRAVEHGVQIVVASGRYYASIPQELRENPNIRYYICINGAVVFDMEQGIALHREELPLAVGQAMYDALEARDAVYDCYQDDTAWMDETHYAQIDAYAHDPGMRELMLRRNPVKQFRQVLIERGRPLQKIMAFFKDGPTRDRAVAELAPQFPELSMTVSLDYNIEINSAAAHKGSALKALVERLGLGAENVMAFGDGTNDITMIEYAGTGVVMENGAPECKAIADQIAPHHNEDGVAQVLEALFPD